MMPLIEAAHERISGVYIECLAWQDFITRWDRPQRLASALGITVADWFDAATA